ncbi:MAG TPA: hypothetical protein VMU77_06510, partial [Acidimicrobiales bacterium]|nr:hypothetical protein [Acidimicrobiales bacterium]
MRIRTSASARSTDSSTASGSVPSRLGGGHLLSRKAIRGSLAGLGFATLMALPAYAAGVTTTTASGYPGTTSASSPTLATVGTVPSTIFPLITTTIPLAATTTLPGTTTTIAPGSTTTSSVVPATQASLRLRTYYSAVTMEGTQACSYQPNSPVSVTLDGQIGPTLQADKNGCVAIAITYVGNTQFTVTGSTIRYTLQEGQNQAVLTGTGTDGGPLVTAVNFDLHTIPTTGNAASIKGKGIPLSWAVIAGAIVDALLLGSGALLRYRYGQ